MEKKLPTRNRSKRSTTFQCPFCDDSLDLSGHENHSNRLSRHILDHCFKDSNGQLMYKATKNESNLKKLKFKIGKSSRTEAIGIIVRLRQLRDEILMPTKGEFSTCYTV